MDTISQTAALNTTYNPWASYSDEKGNDMNHLNLFDTENHTFTEESEQSAERDAAQKNSNVQDDASGNSETENTAGRPKTEKEMRDTVEKIMRASAAETQEILRGMFGSR